MGIKRYIRKDKERKAIRMKITIDLPDETIEQIQFLEPIQKEKLEKWIETLVIKRVEEGYRIKIEHYQAKYWDELYGE